MKEDAFSGTPDQDHGQPVLCRTARWPCAQNIAGEHTDRSFTCSTTAGPLMLDKSRLVAVDSLGGPLGLSLIEYRCKIELSEGPMQ